MNIDDDLYSDLPGETTSDYIAKLENELDTLRSEKNEFREKRDEFQIQLKDLNEKLSKLQEEKHILQRNISSLFKTAKSEISRKDALISELQSENDDMKFGRRKSHRKFEYASRERPPDHRSVRERYHRRDSPQDDRRRIRHLDERYRRRTPPGRIDEIKLNRRVSPEGYLRDALSCHRASKFKSDQNVLSKGVNQKNYPTLEEMFNFTKPIKLITPLKDTPDHLKEKFNAAEKINAIIPMLNDRRVLSPFKNIGVFEVNNECSDCSSVTVSVEVEHAVFSRKGRKRPIVQIKNDLKPS